MSSNSCWQDFQDPVTRAWARITKTHLVVLDAPASLPADKLPREHPLREIKAVRVFHLPGDRTAVAAQIPGLESSPGLRFSDRGLAQRFGDALSVAAGVGEAEAAARPRVGRV